MKNIFVGNLGFETTEQEIRSLFEKFGVVERVNLIADRDTGRSRGFAFVEMQNDGEGDAAIAALSGIRLGGRSLTINEARPRVERGHGPRGSSSGRVPGNPYPHQARW